MFAANLLLLCVGGVSVALPQTAQSTGLELEVAEIAKVTGDDAALVAKVQAASLGYAPAPGYHRTLRKDLIQASLRQALPGIDIRVTGAPRCRVSPEVAVVRGSTIQAQAAQAMRAALSGADASAEPEGVVRDIRVPKGDEPARIVIAPVRGRVVPGLQTVQAEIWMGDRIYQSTQVTFRVAMWKRQAVLRRAVNAGEELHAGLFEVRRVPVSASEGLYSLDQAQLAGAVALKPMAAGSTVAERDVHRQVVVSRGDIVTVRVTKGSVSVADIGVAQADGRTGERVRVTLRSTGREIIAVVTGPKNLEVKIQ